MAFFLAASTVLPLIPTKSVAQFALYCYMVNEQGKTVDLGSLCGVKHPSTPIASAPMQPQKLIPVTEAAPVTKRTMDGFAYIYAEQYCDWREAGGRSRKESEASALKELTNKIILVYGADGASEVVNRMDADFFNTTDRLINNICPKTK